MKKQKSKKVKREIKAIGKAEFFSVSNAVLASAFVFMVAFWATYFIHQPSMPTHVGQAGNNSYSVIYTAYAQATGADNPNNTGFKLVVCDGPTLPTVDMLQAENTRLNREYVPCDFYGVMSEVRHLINIAIILGVLGAVLGFTYAGFLYVTGVPAKISRAREIFQKVFVGFIIMLSAWFIVFQILSWLTDNAAFKTLLGK